MDEIFIIVNRHRIERKKLYQIKDADGNLIKSRMYEEQLIRASVMNKSFEIKEIIKQRVEKCRKQSLVLFHGYKRVVWIHNSQMTRIWPKSTNI